MHVSAWRFIRWTDGAWRLSFRVGEDEERTMEEPEQVGFWLGCGAPKRSFQGWRRGSPKPPAPKKQRRNRHDLEAHGCGAPGLDTAWPGPWDPLTTFLRPLLGCQAPKGDATASLVAERREPALRLRKPRPRSVNKFHIICH